MLLGRLLFLLRTDAGLTQRHAACQLHLSANYLSMVEHDKTIPTEARVRALAGLYGCDPKPLLLARAQQLRQQAQQWRVQARRLRSTAASLVGPAILALSFFT